jgi:hypothetical protein
MITLSYVAIKREYAIVIPSGMPYFDKTIEARKIKTDAGHIQKVSSKNRMVVLNVLIMFRVQNTIGVEAKFI